MNQISKLIVALVICSGCNSMSLTCYQEFTAGGMNFCIAYETEHLISVDMIEEIVAIIEDAADDYYPQIVNVREVLEANNVNVIVTDMNIVADCIAGDGGAYLCEKDYAGYDFRGDSIVIEKPYARTCFFASALMHEILHSVDKYYLGGWNHDTSRMFKQNYPDQSTGEWIDTIEYKAQVAMNDRIPVYPDQCSR